MRRECRIPSLLRLLRRSAVRHRANAWVQAAMDRDRGANVVETIIIVAGFAILAAAIYAAVAGKVHTWIAKIP